MRYKFVIHAYMLHNKWRVYSSFAPKGLKFRQNVFFLFAGEVAKYLDRQYFWPYCIWHMHEIGETVDLVK